LSFDDLNADLTDEAERWRHRAAIGAALARWVGARDAAEVATRFRDHGVLWAPFRTFKEVVAEDPAAAGLLATRPADPVLGADTEAVLEEIGEDVEALRAAGVIV
jgi:2-methylfumaryl-CoA isomerase